MSETDTVYRVNSDQVAWSVFGEETVLIDYQSHFHFSLNQTGTFIWKLLTKRPMSCLEIAKKVAKHYGKAVETVKPDVARLLAKLAQENLLAREREAG